MRPTVRAAVVVLIALTLSRSAAAGVPASLCVQGYLESNTNNPTPINGTVCFEACIYDASSCGTGNCVWGPSAPRCITVVNGLFAITLGDDPLDPPLTPDTFGNPDGGANPGPQPRWIEFSTAANSNGQFSTMCPRVALASAPYAERVGFVGNAELTDNVVLGTLTPQASGSLRLLNGQSPNQETITLDAVGGAGEPELRLTHANGSAGISMGAGMGGGSQPLIALSGSGTGAPPAAKLGTKNSSNAAGSGYLELFRGDGITASASVHATDIYGGEFLGWNNSGLNTFGLTGGASGGGAFLNMSNGRTLNALTVTLNSDNYDGAGMLVLSNSNGLGTLFVNADTAGGPALSLTNGTGLYGNPETVRIDGGRAQDPGGEISVRNGQSSNQETITLDGNNQGSLAGRISLRNGQSPNQETITLDANPGRIGIGTNSPQAKLEIAGTPGVDGIRFPDGTVQTTAAAGPGAGTLIGEVRMWAGSQAAVPSGWLLCDGTAVSRTQFAGLFAAIGVSWGAGDGSTTFNLPDLRGRFVRGADAGSGRDPDVGSRSASGPGGNTGGGVGSAQSDTFQGHFHNFEGGHIPYSGGGGSDYYAPQTNNNPDTLVNRNNITDPKTDGQHGTPRVSAETRPINVYMNFIIKSLLSGHNVNSNNWLRDEAMFSTCDTSEKSCKIGVFSMMVTLRICNTSFNSCRSW